MSTNQSYLFLNALLFLIVTAVTVHSYRLEGRIINGTRSDTEPWVTQILLGIDGEFHQHCGGSLISSKWILSAAHCFFNDDGSGEISVDLELLYISIGSTKHAEGVLYRIKNVYQNGYRNTAENYVINDIALVELALFVPPQLAVPVLLPEPNVTYGNMVGKIFGWGVTNDGKNSKYLLVAKAYISSPEDCHDSVKDPNKICIDPKHTETNIGSGDSGGPLAVEDRKLQKYRVVGITSYGDGDSIAVFARVSSYLDWIADVSGVKGE